jgi:hypothetical protein
VLDAAFKRAGVSRPWLKWVEAESGIFLFSARGNPPFEDKLRNILEFSATHLVFEPPKKT